ncbi:avidin-like [Lithobates pipiens]
MRMKMYLALALGLLSISLCINAKCDLTGQWQNDLGSNMTVYVDKNGLIVGKYRTAVSTTNKTILESPLVGYQQSSVLPTFGFTVMWQFTNVITVFTGQCFRNETGQVLQTTWLLREESSDAQHNWMQTRVGFNVFYQIP